MNLKPRLLTQIVLKNATSVRSQTPGHVGVTEYIQSLLTSSLSCSVFYKLFFVKSVILSKSMRVESCRNSAVGSSLYTYLIFFLSLAAFVAICFISSKHHVFFV